jgi:hypothetical protein
MKSNVKLLVAVGGLLVSPVIAASELQGKPGAEVQVPAPGTEVQEELGRELREHPNAVQTGPGELSFDDGKVMLSLGPAPSAQACPRGWWCFFQHESYNANNRTGEARMLRFSDCRRHNLGDYGFRDQASSWVNRTRRNIRTYNDRSVRPDQLLWTMASNSQSVYVGDAANDKADYFTCR